MAPVIDLEEGESLTSFFHKKNNIIMTINIVRSSHREEVRMIKQILDLQKFAEGWKDVGNYKKIVFTLRGHKLKV